MDYRKILEEGKAYLGIEFGSTRIKAVVVDDDGNTICSGGKVWENSLVDGIWTYSEEEIWNGLKSCYSDLAANIKKEYGVTVKKYAAIGISAMMKQRVNWEMISMTLM